MTTTSVHQSVPHTGSAGAGIAARVTRFIIVWTLVGALLDELSDLRTGRSVR